MYIDTTLPPLGHCLAPIMRKFAELRPDKLAANIDTAISLLDQCDGDSDLEDDDDVSCAVGENRCASDQALGFNADHSDYADLEAAWPERDPQPCCRCGGMAGNISDDAEPWRLLAFEITQVAEREA